MKAGTKCIVQIAGEEGSVPRGTDGDLTVGCSTWNTSAIARVWNLRWPVNAQKVTF